LRLNEIYDTMEAGVSSGTQVNGHRLARRLEKLLEAVVKPKG
jgi:hypothetical protein